MSSLEQLQLIESIVEASPAIVFRWIIREGWPVGYVSRNIETLGYTQDDLLSGRVSWTGITHPDDVPRLEQEVEGFLAGGITRWSQTYRIRAHDGSYRWMRDWNLLQRDERGTPQSIEGIVIDITQEKVAEQWGDSLRQELEKALASVLSGFVPICMQCKAIRDSSGSWIPIERYLGQRNPIEFSHGYCPECARKVLDSLPPAP